jgi:Yip1 domain
MGNLSLLTLLVTSPVAFFTELKQKPRIFFPIALVAIASAAVALWYFQVVDIDWMREQMFAANPQLAKMPEAQRAQAMEMTGKIMSRGVLTVITPISTVITLAVIYAISALYLLLVGKMTKVVFKFEQWLSLVAWVSLPALLNTVTSAITLAMQNVPVQLNQTDLQPLSLNELLFHRHMGEPGYTLLISVGIPMFISQALTIVGIKVWSERSWAYSAVVTMLPYVVIYGLWALVAFH